MTLETSLSEAKGPTRIWLPIVPAVGVLAGVVLSFLVPGPSPLGPPPFGSWRYDPFGHKSDYVPRRAFDSRHYLARLPRDCLHKDVLGDTREIFPGVGRGSSGAAHATIRSVPLFLGLAGPFQSEQGKFLSCADIFKITTYTIFFYLSLE